MNDPQTADREWTHPVLGAGELMLPVPRDAQVPTLRGGMCREPADRPASFTALRRVNLGLLLWNNEGHKEAYSV